MKLEFLVLPEGERRLYLEQAAVRRHLSPVILEKDFWVCWLLGILFESEFADSLVFKGGTSLSKVFGVINRFSEDVDLSLSPAFLKLPEVGTSRNQANKWMAKAEAAGGAAVQSRIAPVLEADAAAGILGSMNNPGSRIRPTPPRARQSCTFTTLRLCRPGSSTSNVRSSWSLAR